MAWNKKRLFTPFPIDRLQQTVHITRLLKSSIFFTIDETDSTNALAISSCLICGSIENVSHRFPSMIPYPSALSPSLPSSACTRFSTTKYPFPPATAPACECTSRCASSDAGRRDSASEATRRSFRKSFHTAPLHRLQESAPSSAPTSRSRPDKYSLPAPPGIKKTSISLLCWALR